MTAVALTSELMLPCGRKLPNRFAKSAMSENMGSPGHVANSKFEVAYDRWARGGCGLLITGNVMVDSRALGEPNNVVIEQGNNGFEALQKWAKAGTKDGTQIWVQLNHPGKQSPKFLSKVPVAPSAVPLGGAFTKLFNCPRELTEQEILEIIERFAFAAKISKEAGFNGVQIHGAHGYLVSQFLSPRHNIRTDRWGGSLENRMRFVLEVYKAMRREVGADFPVGIKINSADFQKGGFGEDESLQVAQKLSEVGMDLIEISGGTYESPEMTGYQQAKKRESTVRREAYFLEFCKSVRTVVKSPLMLTGGFRTLEGMHQALEAGACDVIGLARPLALRPDFPKLLLEGKIKESEVVPLTTGFKSLDKMLPLEIIWYTNQIHRMGKGKDPNPRANVFAVALTQALAGGIDGILRVRS